MIALDAFAATTARTNGVRRTPSRATPRAPHTATRADSRHARDRARAPVGGAFARGADAATRDDRGRSRGARARARRHRCVSRVRERASSRRRRARGDERRRERRRERDEWDDKGQGVVARRGEDR